MSHIKSFKEKNRANPKFKLGDKIVILPTEARYYRNINGSLKHPASMLADYEHDTIVSDADWHSYDLHPNGGYWEYELADKANECPEDFLALYDENAEYYDKPEFIR